MKKFKLTLLLLLCITSAIYAQIPLTDAERKKAVDHLENSNDELLASVKGLSDKQLNFKPSPESWSIAEVVEHLAISESNIFGALTASLETEPDPAKRSEVKMGDDEILGFISTRDQKVKTSAAFEPSNKFGSYDATLKEFKTLRKANLTYLKKTDDDLRNRYAQMPFGTLDAYQVALFMSGHVVRHTAQIEEVKADPKFPTK